MKEQLKCPKCGNTLFNVWIVTFEDFLRPDLYEDTSVTFHVIECSKCKWKSFPTEREEAIKECIRRLKAMGVPFAIGAIKDAGKYLEEVFRQP